MTGNFFEVMFLMKTKFSLADGRLKSLLLIGMGVALIILILLPYMINGMWSDDSYNCQIWGQINRFHSSLWAFNVRTVIFWIDHGRMLFFLPFQNGFFYLLRDVRVIRLAHVAILLTHIGCVVYLLRQIRFSWPTIGVFVLFLVSLFQIRNYHDPIAAFAPTYQVLGLFMTAALIFLVKWYRTGSSGYLIASSLVLTLSLFFYELNAIYIPIAVTTILVAPRAKRITNLLIVLIPFAIWSAIYLYVKSHSTGAYAGTSLGDIRAVPWTYLKQFSGAFPGSFYYLQEKHDYHSAQLFADLKDSPIAWAIGILSFISYFLLAKKQNEKPNNIPWGAVCVAAVFLFLPPLLISITQKYQSEVTWGRPYLPVYYQYFGLAFLGALASEKLARTKNLRVFVAVAFAFSLYTASNWTVNMHEVHDQYVSWDDWRDSLVAAMKAGLLDKVQDGDIVEMKDQPCFVNGGLIYQTIGKNVSIPNENRPINDGFEEKPRPSAKRFKLFRDPKSGNAWRLEPVTHSS